MRISDWSSDVCSSDLQWRLLPQRREGYLAPTILDPLAPTPLRLKPCRLQCRIESIENCLLFFFAEKLGVSPPPCPVIPIELGSGGRQQPQPRSEEHTSELQSLMRISYAVFCLKKKKKYKNNE